MSDRTSMDPGSRSSAAIEREVETARAGVASTLGELRERAAPGPLIEQALDYARSSGGAEMMRNLGAQIRDNPLPLLMIGAGMGWLMLGGAREGHGHAHGNGTSNGHGLGLDRPLPGGGANLLGMAHGDDRHPGRGNGEGLLARAGDVVDGVRDSVAGSAERVTDATDGALRRVADTAGELADRATSGAADLAHQARGQAAHMADAAQQGVGWLLREQPLVLGALGVAVGAALGALLPGTEAENRLMGERRDALLERAESVAQVGYERVRDVATRHGEQARDAAGAVAAKAGEQLGGAAGVAERGGDAIADAARGAREAVRDVARGLADEARGAIDHAAEPAPRHQPAPTPRPTAI